MEIESLEYVEALWDHETLRRQSPDAGATLPAFPEMPAGRFTDPAFAQAEHEHLWRNVWIFAGHSSEIAKPGDYLTREIDGIPVILTHGKDGVLRAFYNVCPHRGARLLREDCGHTATINCPYHCWSFGLNGELLFVPEVHDFPGLRQDTKHLRPIACAQFRGLVFFSLAEDPEPLENFIGGLAEALADVPIEQATLFHRAVVPARCNWKAVQDAFSETYHVRYVHAQSVNLALDQRYTARYMLRGGHNAMIVKARQGEGNDMVNVFDRTGTVEGEPGSSGMRPVTRLGQRSYNLFPNLTIPIAENLFPIQAAWPDGVDGCKLEVRFLKLAGGQGSVADDQSVVEAFLAILNEDLTTLAGMQESIRGSGIAGLVLGHGEQFIQNTHQQIDRVIGPEHIPKGLAMTQIDLPYADAT